MNNGVDNQGIRCFRGVLRQFFERVVAANPGLETRVEYVQPRNLGELPADDADLYLSSGGPGSPFDGQDEAWSLGYRKFVDNLMESGSGRGPSEPTGQAMFAVCYSFELLVCHFKVATMRPRATRKFGVMPIYPTGLGMVSPLMRPFGDRLFAFEHRSWEAVDLDERKMEAHGSELWARESRDGHSKGEGLVAFRFCRNIEGTIFHPEADRAGALAWIAKPDQAKAVIDAYGQVTYIRMLQTLDDPMRLARTYAVMVPGWLARRFNRLARLRDWNPIEKPVYDPNLFKGFGRAPVTEDAVPIEVSSEGA
jgi:GMP synthase-like glutamine amidotransferase